MAEANIKDSMNSDCLGSLVPRNREDRPWQRVCWLDCSVSYFSVLSFGP